MPEAGKAEGRLDLALEAIEAGNLVHAVALAQQSVDFEDADVSESRWLLGRLLEEPVAFRLWNALRYLQLGSHRDAWLLVDRVHRKRMPNPQERRDPQFDPEVMERELRTVLSTLTARDLPPVSALRRYFEVLDQYPFNEVLTHYWKALAPKLSRQPGPERGEIVTRGRAPRRSPGREAGPSRGIPGPTAAAGEASPPPPPGAPAPPPRRSAPPDGVTYGRESSPPAGVPASAPAEALTTIRRTPHMDVEPEAAVKGLFAVVVYADQLSARPGEDVDEIEVRIPETQNEITVEVRLVPSNHFEVVGAPVQTLRILRDTPRSNDARFQMAARSGLEDFGGAFVSAYFHYEGRPCGRVKRVIAPDVLEEILTGERREGRPATARRRTSPPPRPPDEAITQPEGRAVLSAVPGAPLADILVEVVSRGTNFLTTVRSKLAPGYENGIEETWFLDRQSAADIVHQHFEDFMTDANPSRRRDYLIGAGKQLFRAAPKSFQKLILGLDPKNPPSSLLVCTEEPYVPWELMVPNSRGKPSLDWNLPIGAVIPTGRWASAEYLPPVARIRLEASYLIAPTYAPPLDSSAEARILQDRFSCQPIRPAALREIDKALEDAPRGLLHFACHGNSSPQSRVQQITLEGEPLDPTLLEAQPGFRKAIEAASPLVFLNACEVGRVKPGLVATSGFAESFIALGAGAVIAPLWQVDDKLAGTAAQDFYSSVAADPSLTFARAVSKIRSKAYEPGREMEDSFAAYTLYGDPLATRG